MRVTKKHFDQLKSGIAKISGGRISKALHHYKEQGYSATRFYMDIFYQVGKRSWDDCNNGSYSYQEYDYNDSHIETAIKQAVKEVHTITYTA